MSFNWHWKTKDVTPWTKQWLSDKLAACATPELKIVSVRHEGDSEVGMRKGKVITIYDIKVVCSWKSADGEVEGELTAVEVTHDMEEDDYQFEASCTASSPEAVKLKEIARTKLADQMRPIFQQFPKDMAAVHGKDLLVTASNGTSPSNSGTSTPAPAAAQASVSSNQPAAKTSAKSASGINTTTVSAESSFVISGGDLFELLTDEKRVPTWTRNPAKIRAEPGAEVSLFGGNITGKMLKVEKPTSFQMSWRAPSFPEGHYGTLNVSLEQGSSDTKLTLRLDGVPLGKEEEVERNLDIYYIRSLKQIGYALYPHLSPPTTSVPIKLTSTRVTPRSALFLSLSILTLLLAIAWSLAFGR